MLLDLPYMTNVKSFDNLINYLIKNYLYRAVGPIYLLT